MLIFAQIQASWFLSATPDANYWHDTCTAYKNPQYDISSNNRAFNDRIKIANTILNYHFCHGMHMKDQECNQKRLIRNTNLQGAAAYDKV